MGSQLPPSSRRKALIQLRTAPLGISELTGEHGVDQFLGIRRMPLVWRHDMPGHITVGRGAGRIGAGVIVAGMIAQVGAVFGVTPAYRMVHQGAAP